MILSQSVVADVIPARERGKYMGIIGGVFAFSSVAGRSSRVDHRGTPAGVGHSGLTCRLPYSQSSPSFSAPAHRFQRPRKAADRLPGQHYSHGWNQRARARHHLGRQSVRLELSADYWASHRIRRRGLIFIPVENRAAEPIMPMYLFTNRNFLLTLGALSPSVLPCSVPSSTIPTYLAKCPWA